MAATILIVDDAETCAATLEIALAVRGFGVASATTAEEALERLAKGGIGALVTDLHLPRMDGCELIELLRAQPDFARLPIVVISGDSDPGTPERMLRLGADAFFTKPYSPAEVRQKLEQLVNGSQLP